MGLPIKKDDLGVLSFLETSICANDMRIIQQI